jgi:hypothetical protein
MSQPYNEGISRTVPGTTFGLVDHSLFNGISMMKSHADDFCRCD